MRHFIDRRLNPKEGTEMTTILRIDASARTQRSLSRMLGDRFNDDWQAKRPEDEVAVRGLDPAHDGIRR